MSTIHVFLISLLSAVMVVGGTVWWVNRAHADSNYGHTVFYKGNGHHFKKVHRQMGERFCGEGAQSHIEKFSAMVEDELKFNDTQKVHWDAFTDAVKSNLTLFAAQCESFQNGASKNTRTIPMTPEKLAKLESLLGTGIQFIQSITPYYEGFYNTLTDDQKQKLSEHSLRHPQRHWH